MDEKEYSVRTVEGQTVARQLYVVYGNCGEYAEPDWHPIGKRVEDSSAELDYSDESSQDILGNTFGTMKKPIITQDFDPCPIDAGDKYQQKLLQLAIVKQDVQALANQDLLRVHLYLTDEEGNAFAERFPASMVKPNGPGGEGGGNLTMPTSITFGGTRETGSAKVEGGKVTFTKDVAVIRAENPVKVASTKASSKEGVSV